MHRGQARFDALRSRRVDLVVFAGYTLVAFLVLGSLLFIETGSRYVGYGYDPQIFIWSFAWWPHAILHGQNPFVTHAIWAPDGVNLTWTTSVPGLAVLFAPLTLIAGPIVSYDVAAILMPAFAAWTAFVLCRYLTRSLWPSVVGGYLFGFSSYLLAQGGGGHLQLSSVFLLPLVALVLLRFLDGGLSGRGLVLRLGPLLALQLLMGTEVAFTLTLAIVVALLLCAAFVPARRAGVVSLLPWLAAAYLFGGLLTAPFLYYILDGWRGNAVSDPESYLADLLNFVVPTKIIYLARGWASPISARFPGNVTEENAYLGVPTLLMLLLYFRRRLRSPGGRFLLASLVAAVIAALGARLTVGGHALFSLPWRLFGSLPVFENVLATRFPVYVALVAAIVVALWMAGCRPGLLRWALPGLAILATVPFPARGGFATAYHVPPFFTESRYRSCVSPGEIVLPLPIREFGDELLWQTASGFRFAMAGGEIGPAIPDSFQTPGAMQYVIDGNPVKPRQAGILRTFIARKHVTTVIVDQTQAKLWTGALDTIASPHAVGGVVLYHLGDTAVQGTAPPCPVR